MEITFLIVGGIALLIVERIFISKDVPIRGGRGDKPTGPKPKLTQDQSGARRE